MKSQGKKKRSSARNALLGGVLKKNEEIKKTVRKAADRLTLVNRVLKQGRVPLEDTRQAITQNEDIENTISAAANDLALVNAKLAQAMTQRRVIETELADTRVDLAEARDDLSKSQVREEEAQQLALQDALTGLPNRILFEQSLAHGLLQAKRHGRELAILFLDIDDFKSINDTFGHDVGDQVLPGFRNQLKPKY